MIYFSVLSRNFGHLFFITRFWDLCCISTPVTCRGRKVGRFSKPKRKRQWLQKHFPNLCSPMPNTIKFLSFLLNPLWKHVYIIRIYFSRCIKFSNFQAGLTLLLKLLSGKPSRTTLGLSPFGNWASVRFISGIGIGPFQNFGMIVLF